MVNKSEGETLEEYLDNRVFANNPGTTIEPDEKEVEGFNKFIELYKNGLPIEKAAVENMPV